MIEYKYIYGPVPSWRLGSSLGIDLLSQKEKICNFDCVYCQLGPTKKYTVERKIYVPVEKVIEELGKLPGTNIDYITFSGRGEPTLAANLGEAIKAVKLSRKEPIAVLTNSSLMELDEVRKELIWADFVVAKLDAYSPESLREINRPVEGIEFGSILEGIKAFKKNYKGKLALQIMFMDNNKNDVNKFIYLANYIKPDEIQLNIPLRSCGVKPLAREEIAKIKDGFTSVCKGVNMVSVYDERKEKDILSISDEDTLKRRGKVK
ncbi:MAG: radical SAM protein [Candidatus Omnitrophica bacterium]|nr:radical SAM protein [Candidatus Omnitrophota bacterium]MDD5352035.1 radical SAM protein [Candidatus Omnitrophota bacterium]MDD5551181.1 radical SAM protein [Candidatus Omnitrophota bacterium]